LPVAVETDNSAAAIDSTVLDSATSEGSDAAATDLDKDSAMTAEADKEDTGESLTDAVVASGAGGHKKLAQKEKKHKSGETVDKKDKKTAEKIDSDSGTDSIDAGNAGGNEKSNDKNVENNDITHEADAEKKADTALKNDNINTPAKDKKEGQKNGKLPLNPYY
jgi:hypothetical protein